MLKRITPLNARKPALKSYVTVPQAVCGFEMQLRESIFSEEIFCLSRNQLTQPQTFLSAPHPLRQAQPVHHSLSTLLYPLTVLYLISLLPIVRSVQLLV